MTDAGGGHGRGRRGMSIISRWGCGQAAVNEGTAILVRGGGGGGGAGGQ